MKMNLKYFILLLFAIGIYENSAAQKFTLPIFPDTQGEVGSKPDMFYSQIKWIIKKKDSLNIPMVLHVGDLVDFDNFSHWDIAAKGFAALDKYYIPYAISPDSHDTEAVGMNNGSAAPGNVNQNLRKTFKFNSYFPTKRFINQRGRMESDKSDNAYYTFNVGNTYWQVITLEFCPRLAAINWAGDIAKAYFNYNTIILTHYHLASNGSIEQSNGGYGDFSPQIVFDKLVRVYPNIRFVISGHVMSSALKVDTGINGNKIYQILQNYQNEDLGGGYLRLLCFDLDKSTVSAKMYSPFYNVTKKDSSEFIIKHVDFLRIKAK